MRKVRPKTTKKEREENKNKKKLNEICKPIFDVGLILSVFVEYLQEHKSLYDNEETYIKPYLKGYLTSVINRTKEFIKYNYFKEKFNSEPVKELINTQYIEALENGAELKEEFYNKESEINCRIVETFSCALICMETIKKMFIQQYRNPIYYDFKIRLNSIFSEFEIYDIFFQNEIQTINIK